MKKLLAILLTVIMCAALFGCGGKKTPDESAEQPGTQQTTEQTTPVEGTSEIITAERETDAGIFDPTDPVASDGKVYLVSDDSHYVLDMGNLYLCYFHDGETINGCEAYADLGDAETAAKSVEEYLKTEEVDEMVAGVEARGQYMVVIYTSDAWNGVTLEALDQAYGDKKVD